VLCSYGCGRVAKFKFKNGNFCCCGAPQGCPAIKEKVSKKNKNRKYSKKSIENFRNGQIGKIRSYDHKKNISIGIKKSKKHKKSTSSEKFKEKMRKIRTGAIVSEDTRYKLSKYNKFTLENFKEKYPLLFIVEEIIEEEITGDILVHCKNHNCFNSKEKGGWFKPTYIQLYERIRNLDRDGSYFYCCDACKKECPLYYLRTDPLKKITAQYTKEEYEIFRKFVLERDNYKCQYCGKPAEHVHHERPQKIEPFFSLDPDLAWSVCKECHYKYGHKDECSTGKLSTIICI
jgi:hypothetical protein